MTKWPLEFFSVALLQALMHVDVKVDLPCYSRYRQMHVEEKVDLSCYCGYRQRSAFLLVVFSLASFVTSLGELGYSSITASKRIGTEGTGVYGSCKLHGP